MKVEEGTCRKAEITVNEERKKRKNKNEINCSAVPKTRHFSLNSFASVVK